MKHLILSLVFFNSVLFAGIPVEECYRSPTSQLICREGWDQIEDALLEMGIPAELIPFFGEVSLEEDWGHIGYHGTNQGYRIFQDVIRLVVEEVLDIPLRDDFHFLRIPGDSDFELNSMYEFVSYWGEKVDNKSEKRAKQLISLNFSVYSNFDEPGSCSLNLFVQDMSKNWIDYRAQLIVLFHQLGISTKCVDALLEIGNRWLDDEGGILLQISESSHLNNPYGEAYLFADMQCYPAKRGGHRCGSDLISNQYRIQMSDSYVEGNVEIAPQLRLLMNTRHTLNPFSHLRIRRWDLYDADTICAYEKEMRKYAETMPYNQDKVKKFRSGLMKKWGI
jgi:hypothetical protein